MTTARVTETKITIINYKYSLASTAPPTLIEYWPFALSTTTARGKIVKNLYPSTTTCSLSLTVLVSFVGPANDNTHLVSPVV